MSIAKINNIQAKEILNLLSGNMELTHIGNIVNLSLSSFHIYAPTTSFIQFFCQT